MLEADAMGLHRIFDCTITASGLNHIIQCLVPERDPYMFVNDEGKLAQKEPF